MTTKENPSMDLDELERLLEAATPGPWAVNVCLGTDGGAECWRADPHQDIYRPEDGDLDNDYGEGIADIDGDTPEIRADAALIVAAVNSLPALIAAARRAEELEKWEAVVVAAWGNSDMHRLNELVGEAEDRWMARATLAEGAPR